MNTDLLQVMDWDCKQRPKNRPSIGTTINIEKLINPYFRVHLPSLKERVVRLGLLPAGGQGDDDADNPVNAMRAIRSAKDFNAHLKQTGKIDASKE